MSEMLEEFSQSFKSSVESRTITVPSIWAEKRRVMGHPFEGPYSFRYHPWCRELHDSKASHNISMKSAQAGFTEVGINLALYTVDVLQKNVLYVLPTLSNSSDFAKTRFDPALSLSPELKRIFTDANNVRLKMAGNTSLYIRGSRGDSNLKSIPVSVLILDELDEMDQTQIELALQRLRGHPESTVWYISTPTVPGHGVALEYESSTKEHFRFRCPSCNKIDELVFPDSILMCGDGVGDPDCHRSVYQCTMCKYQYKHSVIDGKTEQEDKLMALANTGFWEPTVKDADPDRRGFKINQLYNYPVAPGVIVNDYFKSQTSQFAKQEFHKSILGEPYAGAECQVTDQMILEAVRPYSCKELSPQPNERPRMITMGLDRGNWCHYVIAEWFYPEATLDLNASAQCKVLDAGMFLEEDFDMYTKRLMHTWQVRACMVDMDPGPQEARRFARRFPGFVWLNRYRQGRSGKEMTIDDDGSYAPVATVDRTNWLDISLGRFYNGTIELPNDLPTGFSKHIKALVRVYELDKDGNPEARYKNYQKPDHYAHALNYAEIAFPCAVSVGTNKNIMNFL